jgi:hypothetical protein
MRGSAVKTRTQYQRRLLACGIVVGMNSFHDTYRIGFWRHRVPAFLLAGLVTVVWGSIAQTQFNLAALQALGAEVPVLTRLDTTLQDLVGFGPLYAVMVLSGFLLAFAFAALLSRALPKTRVLWFALAGFSALIVAVRLVDALTPPPVLIAATRDTPGLLTMAFGGLIGGLLYALRTRRRS